MIRLIIQQDLVGRNFMLRLYAFICTFISTNTINKEKNDAKIYLVHYHLAPLKSCRVRVCSEVIRLIRLPISPPEAINEQ